MGEPGEGLKPGSAWVCECVCAPVPRGHRVWAQVACFASPSLAEVEEGKAL